MEDMNACTKVLVKADVQILFSVFQALSSVDIGSLICNVGAGGGAAPVAAASAGAPAGGDAPGKWLGGPL